MKKSTTMTEANKAIILDILNSATTREDGKKLKNAGLTAGIICNKINMNPMIATYIRTTYCQKGHMLETMNSTFLGMAEGSEPKADPMRKKADIEAKEKEYKEMLISAGLLEG